MYTRFVAAAGLAAFLGSSLALAGPLTALREMKIVRATGCGQPDPVDGTCHTPDSVEATFVVETGGACHDYGAVVKQTGPVTLITITDTVTHLCAAPELKNFETSITLPADQVRGPQIRIVNPTYVETFQRP
jgi:hypothetical protein